MIKIETKCEDCIHEKICINRNHAEQDMNKLSSMAYND